MGIFDDIQSSAGGTPGIFDDIPNSSSMLRRGIADPAISLLKGAIAVPEAAVGLANIPTMGFAGKAAEGIGFRPKDARSELDTWYSPEQQAANRRVQDAKGFFPTVQAAVENPSVIGHSVAESIPSMLGGAAIARGLLGAGGGALSKAVGTTAAPTIAGAAGEGIIGAGLASEQIRQQTPTGTLTPEQIGYVGASGIGTALIGAAGGAAARKMGLSDIDTMLAGGIGTAGTRGIPARVLGGAVSEGALEEMPQSAQEQAWQNLALNKPVTEGVPEQAAMGLLSGVVMGGAGGIVPQRQAQPAGPLQKAAEAAQPGGVQPANTQPSGNPPGITGIPRESPGNPPETIPGNQQPAADISAAIQNTPAEPEIAPSPVPSAATSPTTNQAESAGVPISQPQEGAVSRGNEAQIAQPAEPGQQAQPAEAADSAAAEQEWRDFVASEGRDIGPRQLAVLRGQFMRRQRMASGIEEATGRVEAARQRQVTENRMVILDTLPLTTTGNTIRRFSAALRNAGIRDYRVSPEERQLIARRVAARDTLQPLEQIPPNELTVPDKPTKPTTPTMPRIEALRRRASSPGVRIVGNRMLDRHGKRLATLTTEEVAQLTANVGTKTDGKTPRQDRRPATDEELASFVQSEAQDIGKSRSTLRALQAIRQQKQVEEADKAELDELIDSERTNLRERFARLRDAQVAAKAKKPFVIPQLRTPAQPTTGGAPLPQAMTDMPIGELGRRSDKTAPTREPTSKAGELPPDANKASDDIGAIFDKEMDDVFGAEPKQPRTPHDERMERPASFRNSNETGHWHAGRSDFLEGKPRVLPSYFTTSRGKNAKDWLRGWDWAKANGGEAPAPEQLTAQTRSNPPATTTRPAAKAAESAVKNTGMALKDVAAGLSALFKPKPGTLGTGLPFDEDTYAAAKPYFQAGIAHFKQAGSDIAEMMKSLIVTLRDQFGMDRDTIANMKPYVVRFMEDAKAGELDYDESSNQEKREASNDSTDASHEIAVDQSMAERQQARIRYAPKRGAGANRYRPGRADDRGVRGARRRADGSTDESKLLGDGGRSEAVSDGTNGVVAGSVRRGSADFRPGLGALTREGSWFDAAKRNIDLIDLAIQIDNEKRGATPDEQALLAKYVGFGASEIRNALFPIPSDYAKRLEPNRIIWPDLVRDARWKPLAERIDALPREWQKSILQSTQYAHYTSEGIIRSIWSAIQRLGFTGGNIFEPGTGIGSFSMLMPDGIHQTSRFTGVEFDAPTALIARLLSPDQQIQHDDFIKRKFPKNYFDVNVGNPPFSQTKILGDAEYAKHGFMLHDFFFAKGIDLVRPGGLQVFVTSKGTMDKKTDRARKFLSDRADLIGAIRLPSTAFEGNAGTSVVTDVIFLKKRAPGEAQGGMAWGAIKTVDTKDGPVEINEYFADHPEMIIGQQRISGNIDDLGRRVNSNGYGGEKYTVVSYDSTPAELDAKFAEAVERLPENVYSPLRQSDEAVKAETRKVDFDPSVKREGVIYLDKDGAILRVTSGVGVPLDESVKLSDKDRAWLKGYVGIRDLVQSARLAQVTDGDWKAALRALNKAYDAFRAERGPILDFRTQIRKSTDEDGNLVEIESRIFKNKRLYREDYDSALLTSLESISESGEIIKAPFLLGRTVGKPIVVEVKGIGDALAVSLDSIGSLDLADIGRRMGLSMEDTIEALGNQIYRTPAGQWQLADEYLSGDVVTKLEEAEHLARSNPEYRRNVEALKEVQPEKLGPSQISTKLGAAWVPVEHVNEFAKEIGAGHVTFDIKTETWQVDGGNRRTERKAGAEYGTTARSASELLEASLNSRSIKVTAVVDKKTVTDVAATTAANEMAKKIKDKFKRWVWTDSDRASELVEAYNNRFNNIAPRKFDGSHLTLPGVSLRFKLHPHQLRSIWRQIQTGDTYLAHAVGAGKTIEMIAGAMEQKRLGLIKKPIFVVPNHMLEQFSNEFMELYPLANIMVADDENFSAERRKAFVASATLNSPDAIIITHSAFKRIGVTEASVAPIRDEIVTDLELELSSLAKDQGTRVRRSQLEQQIEAVNQRFDAIIGASGKDSTIKFEDIGADFIYADEAHAFRKLDFHTAQQIKGIDPNGSQAAMDMYVKTRILERARPGRSFVFASGTPVTNTMGELFTIMRFFAPQELDLSGISTFDSWARQFGEVAPALEPNAAGKYELIERFAKFDNVPELMSRVRQFMDVLTSENLGALVKRPELIGGKPNLNIVESNKALEAYMKGELAARIEKSKSWKPSPSQPNNPDPIVSIITDGRFAAIDPRFFGEELEGESIITTMAGKIVAKYHATKDNVYHNKDGKPEPIKGSTQIVFYNLGFGEQSQRSRGFNSRAAFTKLLTDGGIPRNEVAWFDDANTDAKKEAVFKDMRSGKLKVLIGSAKKMGTGVNVQNRLIALHYQDPPWFPADVEQPHGRIIRQGNLNKEVSIDWYTTKGTYQSTMWQMVGRKQRFIDQAFSGDKSLRSMDDLGEASLFEQAAAVASGDPRALQLAGLRQDVEQFERLQAAHANEQIAVRSALREAEWNARSAAQRIEQYSKAFKTIGERYFQFDSGNVGGRTYIKTVEFGQALKDAFNRVANDQDKFEKMAAGEAVRVGNIGPSIHLEIEMEPPNKKDGAVTGILTLIVKVGDHDAGSIASARFLGTETDAVGLARRAFNRVNDIDGNLRRARSDLVENETSIVKLRKKIGAPFEYQQEMVEKYGELKRLEAELQGEGEKVVVLSSAGKKQEQDNPIQQASLSGALPGERKLARYDYQDVMARESGALPGESRFSERASAMAAVGASPADRAVYEMVSEGRSADEILSFISKASRRPFNRVLAAALRKAGLVSKVTLDSAASFGKQQGAQRYAAAYNSRTDTVALFTPREAERHALHELVHAATMNAIKANGLSAVRLRALFRHVQKSGVADGQYGMSVNKDGTPNLDEFVAELFTKPEFQAFLKTVPAPAGSTLKSAWEWFVRIVARIVGIKTRAAETALDRALVLGAQLMQENVELRAADEARFGIADDVRFSVRNDPPPKKTITVYKLFRVKPGQPGKLFPLFVDANNPAEIGVWLDADVGPLTPIGKVKSSLGPLAFRPGWHGGDLPVATHIGEGGSPPRFRPANQVWAEVEMADDVDWQSEATRRAARTKAGGINAATAHITNQIPKDGSYRYKTNPNMAGEWVISGAMKINRILSDAEVEAINSRAGVADLPRQAPFDAKRYGFDSGIGFSQDQPFGGREIATTPLKPGATTIMVDGVDRPALNSNGKPIHWSEEGVRNFWRWFGDSKVGDADGRPLVVYHGTTSDFLKFDKNKIESEDAFFFTDNADHAAIYAGDDADDNGQIMPMYVAINNPDYSDAMAWNMGNTPTTRTLKRRGHDGFVIENQEGGTTFAAFASRQAKSAAGNTGAFSPTDPDIRFNLATDWQKSPVAREVAKAISAAARSDAALSWLNPVQTQYHKAETLAKQGKFGFKRVFDLGQKFLSDISRFAVVAENAAPTLFHQIRSAADVKQAVGSALRGDFGKQHNADIRAIAAPLYEGTLYGGGNPMAGIVWSDEQLRSRFGLTDRQINLYNEAREAVKVSMDEMAKSLIAKHAKREKVFVDPASSLQEVSDRVSESLNLRANVLEEDAQAEYDETMQRAKDLRDAGQDKRAKGMESEANVKIESQQQEVARIRATAADVEAIAYKAQALQDAGYFPLMRFGRHTVTAKDENGKVQHFSMHDGIPLVPRSGQAQANLLADALREEHPDWTVTTGLMNPEKYKLYQGMSVDALQLFSDHLDAETKQTYQEILRLATNERSALKRMLEREGTPGFDKDVRRTLASFILSNARYTSSAYNLADMAKAAEEAEKDGGDIGAEAVKLYEYVAKPQEEAAKIRGFLFFNFLGGSLAAAIVNATQVPMMTFPRLSQYEQPGKLAARLVRAAKLAVRNPADIHGDIGAALRRAEEDGITAPHQIYEMTATAANNVFTGSRAGSALLRAWGAPFALAESFNRRTTFIAAYQIGQQMTANQLRDAGAASAFEFAEKIVQETQGIYNRGNRVNVGRGAIGATVMSFKQFSVMYLEMLGRLPPKQQAIMAGMLILAAGAGGLPFAEDIEDIIDTIGQWLGYRTNTRRTIRRSLSSVAGQRAADIAMNGVLSQLGVDLHSRLGLHNILPGSALLKPSTTDKSREFQDLLGPAASVVAAMGQALQDLATGRPDKAAMAMAPVAVQNLVKGAKMAATGSAEDMRGKPTIQVSQAEAVAKGIGFNPKSVADYGTAKRDIMQDERLIDVTRERFTSAIVDAIIAGDQEARRDALQQVSEWNVRNPDARISINPDVIRRRVVSMRSEGPERVLKSLSPSLRHQARQEFSSVQ